MPSKALRVLAPPPPEVPGSAEHSQGSAAFAVPHKINCNGCAVTHREPPSSFSKALVSPLRSRFPTLPRTFRCH